MTTGRADAGGAGLDTGFCSERTTQVRPCRFDCTDTEASEPRSSARRAVAAPIAHASFTEVVSWPLWTEQDRATVADTVMAASLAAKAGRALPTIA